MSRFDYLCLYILIGKFIFTRFKNHVTKSGQAEIVDGRWAKGLHTGNATPLVEQNEKDFAGYGRSDEEFHRVVENFINNANKVAGCCLFYFFFWQELENIKKI